MPEIFDESYKIEKIIFENPNWKEILADYEHEANIL